MPLMSAQAYRESLRDGRAVYVAGERVADITRHPILQITVEHSAQVYSLAEDPGLRDLMTVEADGGRISRYFAIPRGSDDLLARQALIEEHTRRELSVLNIVKAIGTDALFALHAVAHRMDQELGTAYGPRVQAFYRHCRDRDLTMAVAQTDVKGDRARLPHEQDDPDLYVHIVAQRQDGIVVRGAKAHTTAAPVVHELIVIPTRALGPEDRDYAVAFAVPVATPGVKLICRTTGSVQQSPFDYPVSRRHIETESLTVFDDVFVPWDRVFLCGEWQFAGPLALTFANFHRFTAISYKPPTGDLFIGAAQLIAEWNGVERAAHIREKIARLIGYTEMIRACARAAALDPELLPPGIALPSPTMTNIGKHHFASQFHEAVRLLQDIAGGLVITAPSEADLRNPETGAYVEKFLRTRKDVDSAARLKLFHLIRDLTASEFGGYNLVVSLHGEGSLEAQLITTYRQYDLERCKALVRQVLERS